MKKYVAIIILDSTPIIYETKTTVITISESNLRKLDEEFVMDFCGRKRLSIGQIFSFSVRIYSYGEYSEEKTSAFNKTVQQQIEYWNEEVIKEQDYLDEKREIMLEKSKKGEQTS